MWAVLLMKQKSEGLVNIQGHVLTQKEIKKKKKKRNSWDNSDRKALI